MQLTKICAIALAAIAMTSVANASHSSSPCGSTVETIDTGAGAVLYLINDDTGTWIYLEQNGHDGLQRGGAGWYEFGSGNGIDTCWDVDNESGEPIETPDFIIL